ncbi:hypothetical protein B0H14DRAFT_3455544 [Mycena olivaceomarginata]|nr:hypothetical protein B0H14DRAFT_3455544 [Mycena olivaceomarginata]
MRLDGPRLGEISKSSPLVLISHDLLLVYSLANNGWIWAADPLKDFAELPSKCYFQREVSSGATASMGTGTAQLICE